LKCYLTGAPKTITDKLQRVFNVAAEVARDLACDFDSFKQFFKTDVFRFYWCYYASYEFMIDLLITYLKTRISFVLPFNTDCT